MLLERIQTYLNILQSKVLRVRSTVNAILRLVAGDECEKVTHCRYERIHIKICVIASTVSAAIK